MNNFENILINPITKEPLMEWSSGVIFDDERKKHIVFFDAQIIKDDFSDFFSFLEVTNKETDNTEVIWVFDQLGTQNKQNVNLEDDNISAGPTMIEFDEQNEAYEYFVVLNDTLKVSLAAFIMREEALKEKKVSNDG